MEEYTANAVVNRNEPIPVVSPQGQGEAVNESKNTTATTNSAQHKHKRSGSTSGRSIQDRLFTKYGHHILFALYQFSANLRPQDSYSRCSR